MEHIKLGDICNIKTGRLDANAASPDGLYPFFTCSKEPLKIKNFSYDCECVLVAGNGDLNVKYYNGKFDAYQRTYIIEVKNKELFRTKYIYLLVMSKLEDLRKKSIGGVIKYIKLGDLSSILVPNISKAKQDKMINNLFNFFKIISIKRKQIIKLNELIKSQFVEMLYLNPSDNKLVDFVSRYKAEKANDTEYPILSITKEFGIVLQSDKFKKRIASDDTSTYKIVPKGKLVQGIHIDERNFAIQNIVDFGIVSPAYKIWNVDESKCNSEVLAYALRSDYVMKYIKSKFTGSVKRRENINYEDFMKTPINLPDLETQNEFYKKMQQIDKQKFEFEKSLKKLEELQSALMQEYFG